MERFLYNQLKIWKDSKTRKPLILKGARQVGKTWLLKQVGKNEFENFIYINCDNNPQMESIFADYDVKRILRNLSAISNIRIESGKCFIVFDEVQEFPKALTSLKYFCEDAPEIHVAAALTGLQRVPTRMWAKADKSTNDRTATAVLFYRRNAGCSKILCGRAGFTEGAEYSESDSF